MEARKHPAELILTQPLPSDSSFCLVRFVNPYSFIEKTTTHRKSYLSHSFLGIASYKGVWTVSNTRYLKCRTTAHFRSQKLPPVVREWHSTREQKAEKNTAVMCSCGARFWFALDFPLHKLIALLWYFTISKHRNPGCQVQYPGGRQGINQSRCFLIPTAVQL